MPQALWKEYLFSWETSPSHMFRKSAAAMLYAKNQFYYTMRCKHIIRYKQISVNTFLPFSAWVTQIFLYVHFSPFRAFGNIRKGQFFAKLPFSQTVLSVMPDSSLQKSAASYSSHPLPKRHVRPAANAAQCPLPCAVALFWDL